jgi:hypothetical protein
MMEEKKEVKIISANLFFTKLNLVKKHTIDNYGNIKNTLDKPQYFY